MRTVRITNRSGWNWTEAQTLALRYISGLVASLSDGESSLAN
jgi:hypothetical protein